MSVSNMRELLAYSAAQKTKRAEEWNQERLAHGYCRGLNHREYMRYRVSGKSRYSAKVKTFHTANGGNIQTKYEHLTII